MYRIGVDVGGTFTDLVAVDEGGLTTLAKVPSAPDDPSLGVLDGLTALAERLSLDRAALLGQTDRIVHGTTVATNALLEHKGARLGLLTTEGHRDVVEMREGLKDDRYNLRMPPPEQLVPRRLRLPVRERIRADGRIDTPLDPASLEAAIAVLQRERVESVAFCYLHAWCDPGHERQTGEALARALPDAYVSLSSAVLPQIKEFERVSTTIVNAYVGPVLSRYLARLESRLAEAGYRGPTLIIQSHGGVAPIGEAGRLAAGAVLSGPAGGAAGSIYASRLLGEPNLIPFDRLAAAHGIHRVINTNMAEGVRLVSVRRGVDPRRFALFAFGGAAGLHATDIARQLGLMRVIVPRVASVLSAWGMLATDLRFELSRTHIGDARTLDGAAVKRLFDEMAADGLARLRASVAGPARAARSVDMRYGEQVFEITVPLDDVDWNAADPLPQIVERFHRRHEALYTYSMPDQEAVLVNARVAVSGILEELPQEPDLPAAPPTSPETERRIYLDDWIATPVYAFDRLAPSQVISGPAIVESATTTVLLRPGDRAAVTPQGWLDIAVGSAAEG